MEFTSNELTIFTLALNDRIFELNKAKDFLVERLEKFKDDENQVAEISERIQMYEMKIAEAHALQERLVYEV